MPVRVCPFLAPLALALVAGDPAALRAAETNSGPEAAAHEEHLAAGRAGPCGVVVEFHLGFDGGAEGFGHGGSVTLGGRVGTIVPIFPPYRNGKRRLNHRQAVARTQIERARRSRPTPSALPNAAGGRCVSHCSSGSRAA
jgi:hypothetical protein